MGAFFSFRSWRALAFPLAVAAAAAVAASMAVTPVTAAPILSATLEPDAINLGESAQLTITNSGDSMDEVRLPDVAGLEFRVIGQSRRFQIINGASLSSTSTLVRVTPQMEGIFTIPAITPASQPLVLRVRSGAAGNGGAGGYGTGAGGTMGGGGGSSPGGPGLSGRYPPLPNGSIPNGVHLTADGSAFIHLALPKRDVYVGESVPVDIQVGMRSGFVTSLNGLPTLTGGDFTLNNLSHQPERTEKIIDGQPFTIFTWHSVLAAVKPGSFSIVVETPLTVRIRTRPQRDSLLEDLLGDPFLQNIFGATVSKDINVTSSPTELKVLALPTEGRPTDFSGAVGTFKITSDLSAATGAAGDPLTLRMHVIGAGNFDRVDSPMLDHVDQWRTYPPRSSFKASDTIGYNGEKTFEQPLIPAHPGAQVIPSVAFSYFDPSARRYETARGAPLPVTITASPVEVAAAVPHASGEAATNAAVEGPAGLRPDHAVSGATSSTLMPLYFQPRFIAIPSVLALLIAGGWMRMRRNEGGRAKDEKKNQPSKAMTRLLSEMQTAVGAGNAALFFAAAKAALTQSYASRWKIAADRLSWNDIDTRLQSESAADDVDVARLTEIRRLFALADEVEYSGHAPTTVDFQRWIQVVRTQIDDEKMS